MWAGPSHSMYLNVSAGAQTIFLSAESREVKSVRNNLITCGGVGIGKFWLTTTEDSLGATKISRPDPALGQ